MKLLRWIAAKTSPKHDRYTLIATLFKEGYAQLHVGEYDKARGTFSRVLEHSELLKAAKLLDYVLVALETTYLIQERYEEQIEFFAGYISRRPGDSTAYCGRASALWYSGQLEKAIHDYSQALELDADNIVARSGRGQVLAEVGSHEKALHDLDLTLVKLAARPASNWDEFYKHIEAFVHRGRGIALSGLGRNDSAMDELDLSTQLSPDNAWAYYSRAELNNLLGFQQKASSDYGIALEKKGPALTPLQRERAKAQLGHEVN